MKQIKEEIANPKIENENKRKKNVSHNFLEHNVNKKNKLGNNTTTKSKRFFNSNNFNSQIFASENNVQPSYEKFGKKINNLNNNSTEFKTNTIFAGYKKGRCIQDNTGKKMHFNKSNICSKDNPLA